MIPVGAFFCIYKRKNQAPTIILKKNKIKRRKGVSSGKVGDNPKRKIRGWEGVLYPCNKERGREKEQHENGAYMRWRWCCGRAVGGGKS